MSINVSSTTAAITFCTLLKRISHQIMSTGNIFAFLSLSAVFLTCESLVMTITFSRLFWGAANKQNIFQLISRHRVSRIKLVLGFERKACGEGGFPFLLRWNEKGITKRCWCSRTVSFTWMLFFIDSILIFMLHSFLNAPQPGKSMQLAISTTYINAK